MKFAIAAAGTGGHLYPALAVADELRARGHDVGVFGGGRLEATAVPDAGYELVQVEIQGLQRSLALSKLRLPFLVRRAAAALTTAIEKRGITAVLVMGGYITVPAAWASRRASVPFVIHEQNGRPGLANKLVARWAGRVLVAFPQAADELRGATVVGNPLRPALVSIDRGSAQAAARTRYGLPADGVVLGVLGGSLGAQVINEAITRFAASPQRPPIVHLAGPDHASALAQEAKNAPIPWRVVAFEDSMEDFYAACDIVVSRAGASTVSELAATGTPAILVPLEAVSQQHNATYLVEAGAARLVPQGEIDRLSGVITELTEDRDACDRMRRAALQAARPGASSAVADALIGVAGG